MAAVMVATALIGVKTSNAQVEQLAAACDDGNMAACQRLMTIARRACLNGNRTWCTVAAKIAQLQANTGSSGYPEHYDPLAGFRDTIEDTGNYIKSYCSDPRMAAQLQAFGYCR
jgi:hypothetical protein